MIVIRKYEGTLRNLLLSEDGKHVMRLHLDRFIPNREIRNKNWMYEKFNTSMNIKLFRQALHAPRLTPRVIGIYVGYDQEKPIAIGMALKSWGHLSMSIYVTAKYRRQGVGRDLVKLIKTEFPDASHHPHDKVSTAFFNKVIT